MSSTHGPKLLAHCPVCQAAYNASEIRLLGEKGAARLFHCTCNTCGQSVLAIVLENFGNISSLGLVTDLELQDALRFRNAEAVSLDECITMHRILQTNSSILCHKLFSWAAWRQALKQASLLATYYVLRYTANHPYLVGTTG